MFELRRLAVPQHLPGAPAAMPAMSTRLSCVLVLPALSKIMHIQSTLAKCSQQTLHSSRCHQHKLTGHLLMLQEDMLHDSEQLLRTVVRKNPRYVGEQCKLHGRSPGCSLCGIVYLRPVALQKRMPP